MLRHDLQDEDIPKHTTLRCRVEEALEDYLKKLMAEIKVWNIKIILAICLTLYKTLLERYPILWICGQT